MYSLYSCTTFIITSHVLAGRHVLLFPMTLWQTRSCRQPSISAAHNIHIKGSFNSSISGLLSGFDCSPASSSSSSSRAAVTVLAVKAVAVALVAGVQVTSGRVVAAKTLRKDPFREIPCPTVFFCSSPVYFLIVVKLSSNTHLSVCCACCALQQAPWSGAAGHL